MKNILVTLGLVLASAFACGGRTGDLDDGYPQETSIAGGSSVETATGGAASIPVTTTKPTGGSSSQPVITSAVTGGSSSVNMTTIAATGGKSAVATAQTTTTVAGSTSVASTGGSSSVNATGGTSQIVATGGKTSTSTATGGTSSTGGNAATGGATSVGMTTAKPFTVTFTGPSAQSVKMGTDDQTVFALRLSSTQWLRYSNLAFSLTCDGQIVGSKGTQYFSNPKLIDTNAGTTVALYQPKAITNNGQVVWYNLNTDSYDISANGYRDLAFQLSIPSTEDASGDLNGRTCYVSLYPNWIIAEDIATGNVIASIATNGSESEKIDGNKFIVIQGGVAQKVHVEIAADSPGNGIVVSEKEEPFTFYTIFNDDDVAHTVSQVVVGVSNWYDITAVELVSASPTTGDRGGFGYSDLQSDGYVFQNPNNVGFIGPMIVPAHGSIPLEIWAYPAMPVSNGKPGVDPISGDIVSVSLRQLLVDGTSISIRNDGVVGKVLHASAPVLTWTPVTEPLHVGVNTIARLNYTNLSDLNPLIYAQLLFDITSGGGVQYERIPTAASTDPDNDIIHVDAFSVNGGSSSLFYSTLVGRTNPTLGILSSTNDDQLVQPGESIAIEMHVNVTSAPTGSWIKVAISDSGNANDYSGPLYLVGVDFPGRWVARKSGDSTAYEANVYWSDLSAGANHRAFDAIRDLTSSADYFTGYLVQGMTGTSIVAAP